MRAAAHRVPQTFADSRSLARELVLLGLLVNFYATAMFFGRGADMAVVNVAGSSTFAGILLLSCLQQLRVQSLAVWSALFWFRIATAVYFGFGALAPYVVNAAGWREMQALHAFDGSDILKCNLINALATLMIMFGACGLAVAWRWAGKGGPARARPGATVSAAVVLLCVGGIARYGFVIPAGFGVGDGGVSSITVSLARAYSAGLMVLLIVGFRSYWALLMPVAILIFVELMSGVVLFRKGDVMATLIFVVLACHFVRPTMLRLATGLAIVAVVFVGVSPLVKHGREQVISLNGPRQIASLDQRLTIVADYLDGRYGWPNVAEQLQTALSRTSYVNAATMVIAWRDDGQPGNTLEHAFAAFVPRLLWSEKPVLTASGTELYLAATGRQGTSISPGLFAEAYWNFGWLGLPLLMMPFGIILGFLSQCSVRAMVCERWIYLPAVLMSIHIGLRVDGHYVPDVIGASFAVLLLWTAMGLAELLIARGQLRSSP